MEILLLLLVLPASIQLWKVGLDLPREPNCLRSTRLLARVVSPV
jgi:hypothetical protein